MVLAALRSPFGVRHGALEGIHPADLLAEVLAGLLARCDVPPEDLDEVIAGCATPVGAQAGNLAGHVVRRCGWPRHVPATMVSTLDSSSLVAVVHAAAAVASGRCKLVLVGGIEHMTTVPAGADMTVRGFGLPPPARSPALPPGPAAERWAQGHGFNRDHLEAVARRSRRRAAQADAAGRLAGEILPVRRRDSGSGLICGDEVVAGNGAWDPAADGSGAGAVEIAATYSEEGLLTAATVSPMADGAAAALVGSVEVAHRLGLEPLARIAGAAIVGGDPGAGCGASPEAAMQVLANAEVAPGRVQRVELAELFATTVLHWETALPDLREPVNPDGGSLALGHPQGATGVALVARLSRALAERPGVGHGLAVCDAVDGHGVAVLLGS
jgi:acetyl-CoA acetyltransferase family protein